MSVFDRIPAVESALNAYLSAADVPPMMLDSMSYALLGGGKRVRPCLLLEVNALLGGEESRAMPFACALEMIHCYSLVHDDLPAMDNDDMRRGRPSCHRVFGEANAILAGDALLTLAFSVLAEAPGPETAKAQVARGALDMAAGQSLDLNAVPADEDALMELHRRKTGALFLAAVRAGACLAGADAEKTAALCAYAEALGLLFQLTDDLLDAKPDAAAGSVSFVTLGGEERTRARVTECAKACACALDGFAGAETLLELVAVLRERVA